MNVDDHFPTPQAVVVVRSPGDSCPPTSEKMIKRDSLPSGNVLLPFTHGASSRTEKKAFFPSLFRFHGDPRPTCTGSFRSRSPSALIVWSPPNLVWDHDAWGDEGKESQGGWVRVRGMRMRGWPFLVMEVLLIKEMNRGRCYSSHGFRRERKEESWEGLWIVKVHF